MNRQELRRYIPLGIIVVATLFSVAFRGFDFPRGNNFYHVPIVLDFANSSEGPHNVFYNSLDRFVSCVWPLLRLVASESNIYGLFLTVHTVFRFLSILVIWRLLVFFGGSGITSALIASLLMFLSSFVSMTPVGWGELLVGYLSHSVVAIPIVLLSWLLVYKKRFLLSALVAGLAFNVNAFMGFWAAVVIGVVTIVFLRAEWKGVLLKTTATMIAVFLLGALPTLAWIVTATNDIAPHESFSYGRYLKEYFPYHTFVEADWPRSLSFALGVGLAFSLLSRIGKNLSRSHHEALFGTLAGLTGVMVLGAILPYVTDVRLFLNLFPLRMSTYVVLLIWVLLALWTLQSLRGDDDQEKALSLVALFGLANGSSILLAEALLLSSARKPTARWTSHALTLLLLGLAILHIVAGRQPNLTEVSGTKALVLVLIQATIIVVTLPRDAVYLRSALLLIAGAFVGTMASAADLYGQLAVGFLYATILFGVMQPRRNGFVVVVVALSILVTGFVSGTVPIVVAVFVVLLPFLVRFVRAAVAKRIVLGASGYHRRFVSASVAAFLVLSVAQTVNRGSLTANPSMVQSLSEAAGWAREHTPPHTMFLSVGVSSFSTESRRPVWMDWRYGAMVMWAPELYEIWTERWPEVYSIQTVDQAVEVARRHEIEYIVFLRSKTPPNAAPADRVLFENSMFWIMQTS